MASGLSNGHVKGETIKPQVVVNAMFDAEKTKATDHDASGPTKTGRTIEGRVTNIETGEPLPGIIIFLKDVGVRTVTDSLGNYSIMVPDTINDDSLIMRVAQIGYDHKDIVIDTHTLPLKIDVALNELERVIIQGGIMAPVMKQSKVQQLRNRIWRWADWY